VYNVANMDNRFLQCAMEEKLVNSSSPVIGLLHENRFLQCVAQYRSELNQSCYSDGVSDDNRFTATANEYRREYYSAPTYSPPSRYYDQKPQKRESVNERARRMLEARGGGMDSRTESSTNRKETTNIASLRDFPELTPKTPESTPSSPALTACSEKTISWSEKARVANSAASPKTPVAHPLYRPIGPAASSSAAFSPLLQAKQGAQKTTEEDIVFDEDGFPYLRMIESIDPSLVKRR
jgi:hypothetical protein